VSLLEIQQNIDVTYRLYDYGRPRELHLDEGMRVAKPLPYPDDFASQAGEPGDRVLVSVAPFTLLRCSGRCGDADSLMSRDRWAVPIAGSARSDGAEASVGECLFLPAGAPFGASGDATILLSAAGPLP
jgi:mannose-6-phosphate isomerase